MPDKDILVYFFMMGFRSSGMGCNGGHVEYFNDDEIMKLISEDFESAFCNYQLCEIFNNNKKPTL